MIPVLMYIPPQNKTVKEQASCRNKESVVREYSRNNGILGESISFSVQPGVLEACQTGHAEVLLS